VFKQLFDIIISLFVIVIISPILLIISLFVFLSTGRPIIFKQERIGKKGVPFILYKFRSMKNNIISYEKSPNSGSDARFIKGGAFLREFSLDELPQLINVLKGDMSIVGPRPLYDSHIRKMSNENKKRLLMKPGITGISQVKYRSELMSEESLNSEIDYITNNNLLIDFKIIIMTIYSVFRKKGVYEK